jgi:hypothetical protein
LAWVREGEGFSWEAIDRDDACFVAIEFFPEFRSVEGPPAHTEGITKEVIKEPKRKVREIRFEKSA